MDTDEKPEHDREWLVEQRYRAVLEVLDGSPVSEVAVRYGVSRQSVCAWKAQLVLARPLAADLRHPWERPPDPARPATPGRVRRGFPDIRPRLGTPARVAKPTRPGPGRPKGSARGPAPRHPVPAKSRQTDKQETENNAQQVKT